jgi:membrane-bound serine protease (ClpP class)
LRHSLIGFACFAAAMLFLFGAGGGIASAQDEPKTDAKRIGQFVHVALPIVDRTPERARQTIRRAIERARRENARLTLIVVFDMPKGQKDFGSHSDYGAAYSLADFLSGEELAGATTVAYLPEAVRGHAVLPVLACQEIIMAKDASLGAAGIDEKDISPHKRSAYAEIAGRRRTVPLVVALGMLDSAMEVLQVETEVDRQFVTPEGLEKLKKDHATKPPVTIKRAGEPCEFSGAEARQFGFVRSLAADRRDVLRALELPANAVADEPAIEGDVQAVRVDLKGALRADSADKVQKAVEDQIREGKNFICLWIESPGGSVVDAMQLVNFLSRLDSSKVCTVAYVPSQARSDAALVALACDQLVVQPQATLGGSGTHEPSPAEIADMREAIRKLAPRKGRSWSLMAAMVDPRLEVSRCTRRGDVEYFCDAELAEQPDKDSWRKGEPVTIPGRPLKLSGTQAEQYGLACRVVDNFGQFREYFGLENDPTLVEPGWADTLIAAMASPGAAVLLLLIGLAGLYVELHSPGVGIGGFVALVCFLLFFWSHYLGGTAGWLEALLFVSGVACLLLEIFVIPGFGIFGLGGGALVLASIVLASQTSKSFIPHNEYQRNELLTSLLTIVVACFGLVVFAALARKRLPRSRLFGHLMLEPPAGEEAETIRRREALVDFHDLVGTRGTTTTQLTPSGKARFGELLVDVIADGEVIGRGAAIEVVEVRGNRVLVREVGE